MSVRETFLAEAARRILITDGAFGTEIQNWKLSEADYAGNLGLTHDQKGNNDILALSKPEVPEAIHRAYFEAGADIAETNTFSANRISQADYGAEHLVREINVDSAKLARRLADEYQAKDGRPRFVLALAGRRPVAGGEDEGRSRVHPGPRFLPPILPATRSPGLGRGRVTPSGMSSGGRCQSPLLPPVFETSRIARTSTPRSTPLTMS